MGPNYHGSSGLAAVSACSAYGREFRETLRLNSPF